ncbi:hypothetical protein ACQKQD_33070 [Methylobacterium sp. NPDC080182]|uniref:hypothetical protein n=1 Tax=Methylobacterium sp. NPDC080182 TaxID=3390590 RepID=UPI003D006431
MADETRTLLLLQQISRLVGVDPDTFKRRGSEPPGSAASGSVTEEGEIPTLKRLLRAYGALTTDEARMAAIRTIEALAAPERQLAPA